MVGSQTYLKNNTQKNFQIAQIYLSIYVSIYKYRVYITYHIILKKKLKGPIGGSIQFKYQEISAKAVLSKDSQRTNQVGFFF